MVRNLINIVENVIPALYHGTRREFSIGEILKPQHDGYVHRTDEKPHQLLEHLLEKCRPDGKVSRSDAVFLIADPEEIDRAGGYTDHVYECEPIGPVSKCNLDWYGKAYLVCEHIILEDDPDYSPDDDLEIVHQYCLNYWNAVPSDSAIYEYLTPQAKIVNKVTNLVESPVGDFQTHNWEPHGSFDKDGYGVLKRVEKKVIPAMGKILSRRLVRSDYVLNFHFVNLTDDMVKSLLPDWEDDITADAIESLGDEYSGELSSEQIRELGLDIKADPTAITFIAFGHLHAADPVSPWMLVHRGMHYIEDGIWRSHNNSQEVSKAFSDLIDTIEPEWQSVGDNFGKVYHPYLTMASAKKGKISTGEETIEMLTQIIFRNRLVIAPNTPTSYREIFKEFEDRAKDLLNVCKGKIFAGF
jgi:hypothetical protein